MSANESARLEFEPVISQTPDVVFPPIETVTSFQFVGFLASVVGRREIHLLLQDGAPATVGAFTFCHIEIREADTREFLL